VLPDAAPLPADTATGTELALFQQPTTIDCIPDLPRRDRHDRLHTPQPSQAEANRTPGSPTRPKLMP